MATEFTVTVKTSGGDYPTSSSAEAGLQNDLTAADIKVFSISAATSPTIAAGDTVLGLTSAATGVCVLVNAARTQILIKTIAVASFQSGEVVKKTTDVTKEVTLSNAGDSPIIGVSCDAFQDTTALTINGWTTSATNYIRWYTITGANRHTGLPATGYQLCSSGFAVALTCAEENVRLEGLSFYSGTNPQDQVDLTASGTCDIRISYCLFYGVGTTSFDALEASAGSGTWKIFNNFFIKTAAYGLNWGPGAGTLYLYNNSFVGCGTSAGGFYCVTIASGTVIAKNNISDERIGSGSSAATGAYNGSFDAASTHNLSTDTSDAGSDTINSATPIYVDVANDNIKLGSTDTACKDQGSDLSADSNLAFSDDIVGTTRPSGSAWDIGAFELVQVSGLAANPIHGGGAAANPIYGYIS